ncbi:DUF2461 domain-containing protein [Seleniivibrio woodruffii]|uniref:DUF2461 domain-containing protein n=1 Tax=Seleniivibrio woodruffii TaxID=1078050 RepID=UPI0039E422FE
MKKQSEFKGFSEKSLAFLAGMRENNEHEWYEAHKDEYVKYVQEPMKALSFELSDAMLSVDEYFVTGGRTVSRIRRDTRFSRNKLPYKSVSWLVFKRPNKDWISLPAFFFELNPEGYMYGMGFYSAEPSTMKSFRNIIDSQRKRFDEAVDFYYTDKTQPFTLVGDKYKRILDASKDERTMDWYQRKNLCLLAERPVEPVLFNSSLAGTLLEDFFRAAPLYRLFLEASRTPAE